MKTFTRRKGVKAERLFEPDSDQQKLPEGENPLDDLAEQDPYFFPTSLATDTRGSRRVSPAKLVAPSGASAGIGASSKQHLGSQQPPPAKSATSLLSAQQANKPSKGLSSGRSVGSSARGPNKSAAAQDKARPVRSGRLLGAHKGKAPAASPAKRDGSEQVKAEAKKAKPSAAARALVNPPASPAAAEPQPTPAALPAAMARLLNPGALRDSAPAQTVMEAQELGEQSRFRDNALWALDGLCIPGSANSRRESAVALLDLCTTRRGRIALRSGGLAEEIVATLGKLSLGEDAVLALCTAAITACLCQADADPALLGREETAQLIAALLKAGDSVPDSGAPASFVGRIGKVMREGPLAKLLPQEEVTSPTSIVLAAVSGVLDPNQRCVNMDPLKHALRQAGALQQVSQLAADHAHALSDTAPTMETVRALWKLNKCLLVLENACFACPDNEAHLAGLAVVGPGGSGEVGLAEWLARQLELLGQQGLSRGFKKDVLRALLAVLMNMTQNNAVGCEGVVAGGVLEAAVPVLAQIARGGPRTRGCLHDREELEVWVDELSCCLGLLINLVEHQPAWRQRLRELQVPPHSASAAAASGSGGRQEMVPLLCSLLCAVIPASRYAAPPSAARRLSDGEITVENLEAGAEGGAESIVEVYASMLLGFLVEGDPQACAQAAALLPTRSLDPVVAAVRRCLQFYVSAGAMTKSNEESLRVLLASLEEGGAGEEGGMRGGEGWGTLLQPQMQQEGLQDAGQHASTLQQEQSVSWDEGDEGS